MTMFDLSAQPWCNHQILSLQRLAPRSFFLTSTTAEKALQHDYDRAECLSGTWDFWYTEDTPLDEKAFTARRDTLPWKTIQVPLSFQFAGYGPLLYTDEAFPFTLDPPHVPAMNPTGVYRRSFCIPASEERFILRFDGVESCASVYVNGSFAGYTQGSRLPAEFDVTGLCRPGENDLLVIVREYCDGTYLEDQDMWWLGGIIRDVWLLRRPQEFLRDLRITADYDPESAQGILKVDAADVAARFTLYDLSGKEVFQGICGENYRLPVTPWNAEIPVLYSLMISCEQESTMLRVGFRRVEITNRELRLNGKRIMLRGVNRHEFSATAGRAVSREETRKDLLRMKQAHINAVRTSHYPNAPFFYDLCDEMGFYVIDECDLETHGFEIEGQPARLADDSSWRAAYLDRAERTFCRDRNHACVIMWSLGNESFRGENLRAMYAWFHRTDSRPVHYEGDISYCCSDVISSMYTPVGRLAERDASGYDKPMILCEFAHAMGNGPGNLLEYRHVIEASERIQGYFIWEWRNHGILRNGEYLHGGDFGMPYHSGNFCMDGLLNSDGTPTPGFFSYAKMNEPIRIQLDGTRAVLRSVLDFRTVLGARLELVLRREDTLCRTETMDIPPVRPGESVILQLPSAMLQGRENALYTLSATVLENDVPLGIETFILREYLPVRSGCEASGTWRREGDRMVFQDDDFGYQVSLTDGRIHHYRTGNRELLYRGPVLSFYRPAMDNDRRRRARWEALSLQSMTPAVYKAETDGVTLRLTGILGADARLWHAPFTLRYTPLADGLIRVEIQGAFSGAFGEERDDLLPRIGTDSLVPARLDRFVYLGFGPDETYPDSCFQAAYGWYKTAVSSLAFPYDCPQESGNRTGCRVSALMDAEGSGIAFISDRPRDTGASFYLPRDLDQAAHPGDLRKRDQITWRFDLKTAGLGSGSCGPETTDRYTVRPLPFQMRFIIAPVRPDRLVETARKGWDALC